jgi:hypothetical protein
MLLLGIPEVTFSSTTATTTSAANLPTSASDATSNAAAVAYTATVTFTAYWAASAPSTTAAVSVATPTAGHNCKACPESIVPQGFINQIIICT